MKTLNLIILTGIFLSFSLTFSSCTGENTRDEINGKAIISSDTLGGAQNTLVKISKITQPEEAKKIWIATTGEVSTHAYTKWVSLMKSKIDALTNPDVAKQIWLNNSGSVSNHAHSKWKQLIN